MLHQASEWDRQDCEDFLLHEARLLDEARFDEWLALFTPDAQYWVPSEPKQQSPHDTVSLMYDDRRLLETRFDEFFTAAPDGFVQRWITPGREILITWQPNT